MNIYKTIDLIESNPRIYEMLRLCPYEILKQWDIKSYPKGQRVMNQGEIYDYFYIITEGFLDIFIMAENGKRYSQSMYTTGNFIGELEIFNRLPYICSVEAVTDVKLLVIKREYFLKWFESDKSISSYITKIICEHLYRLSNKAGQDTLYSLKQRLCSFLIECSSKSTVKKNKIDLQKDLLSDQLAVTPRSINRVLKYLKEKQIIEIVNNTIIIMDLEKLKKEEEISRFE